MAGPLAGIRVLEFAGIGPAPFASMLLSDLGCEVVRVDRPGQALAARDVTSRGRVSIEVDLKTLAGLDICLRAIEKADVLIEGFRPGVMERLGLGPEEAHARNGRLIYGRMTGWGQTGPLAQAAGHDINYIALTGALHAIGPATGAPVPPLNLVGDFGGGSLYLALGIASALFERERSGKGQVIDAAIVDGAASLMGMFNWLNTENPGSIRRGKNYLGGAAHFYTCYECADGGFISIGPLEPQFYALLLKKTGLEDITTEARFDPACWPDERVRFAEVFRRKSRAAWCELLEGSDVCFAPVLTLEEAPLHAHMASRGTYLEIDGMMQPAPAPRFSRTQGAVQSPPPQLGHGGAERLALWGVTPPAVD
jgi:alpha-methylacyl-CoA racemase